MIVYKLFKFQNEQSHICCNLLESISLIFSYQTSGQCEQRPLNGFICIGCDVLAVCIKRNDEWETIPVELCATNDGYQCNAIEGVCSNKTGPCNPINNGVFTCTTVGPFPDPYDCQIYHVCYMNGNNIVSAEIRCNTGMAYNSLAGDCSLSLNANECQEIGFTCEKAGDIGPWRHNPNIFYICKMDYEGDDKVIYPELYKCDPNQIFIKDECITKEFTSTTPTDNYICTKPGIYEDITSCLHYFYCNFVLQAERYLCPENTHFNQVYLSCTIGSC